MKRLTLTTKLEDAMVSMSEGNPGALTVLMQLMKKLGPEGAIMMAWLDDLELYGPAIWGAYKNVCNCDINVLAERLRHDRRGLRDEVLKLEGIR